jgi:cytochrome c-type biogenesis protein CcmH
MTIWVLFTVMTAGAVMAVLWPLSRRRAVEDGSDLNASFYRDQIAEIERDRERGMLSPDEAEAAKSEAARRLLRANDAGHHPVAAVGEPALRRRRAASAFALSAVPILALALYGAFGSPHLPGEPLSARLSLPPEKMDIAAAIAQIEAHLAKDPQDGRGWEVIAPVYLRMGRIDDAAKAYEAANRILGPDPNRLAQYGETLVMAENGIVTADARKAFEQALGLDPNSAKARFYLARAAEQDGDRVRAREGYSDLLARSPTDAPWVSVVKSELARLDGAPEPGPSMPDRQAIQGMVESLARRLDQQGGSVEEWTRLMRSYTVLGQAEKAQAIRRKAREALAQDQSALARIDAMANELKLDSN